MKIVDIDEEDNEDCHNDDEDDNTGTDLDLLHIVHKCWKESMKETKDNMREKS